MADSGATWSRSQDEWYRLKVALEHNCTCDAPTDDIPTPSQCATCPIRMLLDQDALNRFGFGISILAQLNREEWRRQKRVSDG